MAANVLSQYGDQLESKEKESKERQESEMRALVKDIQNLRATFENGRLVVHMDKVMVLELVENRLKKSLARQEAGTTATFKVDLAAVAETDHDAELVLPTRSIFLKFVPDGASVAALAVSYLERARRANPSEYWLLTPSEEEIDFPFEPIFSENRIPEGPAKNIQSLQPPQGFRWQGLRSRGDSRTRRSIQVRHQQEATHDASRRRVGDGQSFGTVRAVLPPWLWAGAKVASLK